MKWVMIIKLSIIDNKNINHISSTLIDTFQLVYGNDSDYPDVPVRRVNFKEKNTNFSHFSG